MDVYACPCAYRGEISRYPAEKTGPELAVLVDSRGALRPSARLGAESCSICT
jgi:hypothetical protein